MLELLLTSFAFTLFLHFVGKILFLVIFALCFGYEQTANSFYQTVFVFRLCV